MQRSEPVPFIMIDEIVQGNQVNYNFKIDPKSFEIFNSEAVKNKKVAIAAIAGPQRTGKSFLSNRLLRKMKGFAIGPTTMPCTKGLWIWGEPIKINDDTVLIIMDTEGLNSVQRDINVDLKIFSLSILLSSVFIYNSIGHIDEKALENMSYVLRISENLKVSSDKDTEGELSKYFPYFYWVLRDFTLDLKGMSESEYLQESLKPISHDQKDPRNQIRSKIRKLFSNRRCDCFPRPVHEEDRLAHIEQLKYDDLRDAFRKKMDSFQRSFYSNLPVKVINGKPITGQIYLNLAHEYVNAMNNGKIPKIKTSLENVIASEVRKACENYQHAYKTEMDKLMSEENLPLDEKEIEENYQHFVLSIRKKFDEKFKHYHDAQIFQAAKTKFNEWLANDYKMRVDRNAKISQVKCQSHLMKIFQEIEVPTIKSSQSLTTNLIPQKMQQFNKRFKDYFNEEKAPKKYTVFTQKFPKHIFDYFSKLVARVKGVYTQQSNTMKKQIKDSRSEVDSVKRVSQEQDNLIVQQRRELASLNDQKDQLQKKIKMQAEIIRCYEDAENSSKSDLKKKYQELQRQYSEMKEQYYQLLESHDKLKSQKSKKEIVMKIEEKNSSTTEEDSTLPNDLIKTIQNLHNKLSVMNQFYEKKVEDDTIEEIIKKQIDQINTDKYKSIEKVRQQFKSKQEQLKRKHLKSKEQYEQRHELMYGHLEDIKNQNIQLQKQLAEGGSQNKIRGLLNERKKFQQSLRQKQNTLNSQRSLNENMKKKMEEMQEQFGHLQEQFVVIKSENMNFKSYKDTFNYVLRESLNFVTNKGNRLQHSLKTLDEEDKQMVRKTLSEFGIKI